MEREMFNKLYQIRQIFDKTNETRKGEVSGHKVGIFSALEEEDVTWLRTTLRTNYFSDVVIKVTLINISDIKGNELEKILTEYTFCIYISRGHKGKHGSPVFKEKLLHILRKKNLILVIDDQEDSSDRGKTKILKSETNIKKYSSVLFLFSKLEKESDYQKLLYLDKVGQEVRRIANLGKHDRPHQQAQIAEHSDNKGSHADSSSKEPMGKKNTVGVFSRSGEVDYSWLVTLLTSEDFKDHIIDVRSYLIANKRFDQFTQDVHSCTFGILYHTKNRGRVNITDVTDSIYDDELQYLCTILGKENVIVVIDDLIDSSDQEKTRILQNQLKVANYAYDLILISHKEKSDEIGGHLAKLKILKSFLKCEIRGENQQFPPPSGKRNATPRSTIGIFSRSEESDFSWLRRLLIIEDSGSKDVRSCRISSNDNETLKADVFQCKFGVLYHTMKSGNIHMTDGQNSLYHEVLESLSIKLGKRKVIVVIDDLENSSDEVKSMILKDQPSIGRLAVDVFLFTALEKIYIDGNYAAKVKNKSTSDKIQRMKEILR
ncbi:uncharacterized protein LOC142098584 [Mixophyes fleayi]|uniref:uncharacterized protein LOC142098584 n=1 Tax=Mixophyes fleayi TaxID=3061075 RepID=UPI003F4DD339